MFPVSIVTSKGQYYVDSTYWLAVARETLILAIVVECSKMMGFRFGTWILICVTIVSVFGNNAPMIHSFVEQEASEKCLNIIFSPNHSNPLSIGMERKMFVFWDLDHGDVDELSNFMWKQSWCSKAFLMQFRFLKTLVI